MAPMPERAAQPQISSATRRLLRSARTLTTPLLPDDYLELINPSGPRASCAGASRRSGARPTTRRPSSIRPASLAGHRPGQYLRLGVEINGVRHWRAYTITSDPEHPEGLVSITVKRVEGGQLSPSSSARAEPGRSSSSARSRARSAWPSRPGAMLFVSAGSGITPIWSLLREPRPAGRARRRGAHPLHARPDDFIFESRCAAGGAGRGYRLHVRESSREGRLTPAELETSVPDWRERDAFLSGPREMIDSLKAHWQQDGVPDRLRHGALPAGHRRRRVEPARAGRCASA